MRLSSPIAQERQRKAWEKVEDFPEYEASFDLPIVSPEDNNNEIWDYLVAAGEAFLEEELTTNLRAKIKEMEQRGIQAAIDEKLMRVSVRAKDDQLQAFSTLGYKPTPRARNEPKTRLLHKDVWVCPPTDPYDQVRKDLKGWKAELDPRAIRQRAEIIQSTIKTEDKAKRDNHKRQMDLINKKVEQRTR